jgi:hypothetical protein
VNVTGVNANAALQPVAKSLKVTLLTPHAEWSLWAVEAVKL